MCILVDKRVGSSFTGSGGRKFDIYSALKDRTNGNVSLTTLDSADFAWSGNGPQGEVYVGCERKALSDMLGSMRSGRYAGDQAKRMADCYDVAILIIEGIYRPSRNGVLEVFQGKEWQPFTLAAKGPQADQYWQYSELDKFVCSIENKKGIVVVRSSSPTETVWQIVNRYEWWSKPWDAHQSTDPIKTQADVRFADISLLRDMASRIEGIGWERSKLIEDHFDSVQDFANALSSELRDAGLGNSLAAKVYGSLRGR